MKKLLPIILFAVSAQAGVTLEWEVDLADELNIGPNKAGNGASVMRRSELSNGNFLLLIENTSGGYSYDGDLATTAASEFPIIILNREGSVIYNGPSGMNNGGSGAHLLVLADGGFLLEHNMGGISGIISTVYFTSNGTYTAYQNIEGSYVREEGMLPDSALHNVGPLSRFQTVDSAVASLSGSWTNEISGNVRTSLYATTNLVVRSYSVVASDNNASALSGHVSSGFYQDNYVLSWESGLGIQYQIQSSTNLVDWTPVGQMLTGTGYPMTWANHVTNSQAFFRVLEL